MKNLSKILLVILAAALVVSSVATFALASTAEEENLVAAQAKLETVVSASSDSVATYATALADLSAFLSANSFDTSNEGYVALISEYNRHALECAIRLEEAIPSEGLENVTVALSAFLNATKELLYVSPVKDKYTGSVTTASAMIGKITENSDRAELMSVLAETYKYVTENPIDPTLDDYPAFLKAYIAASVRLEAVIADPIVQGADVNAKIAALKDIYAYLSATPVSTSLVAVYNVQRARLLEEYEGMKESLQSPDMQLPEIEAEEIEYARSAKLLVQLRSVHNAINEVYATETEKWTAIRDAYAELHNWMLVSTLDLVGDENAYERLYGIVVEEGAEVPEGFVASTMNGFFATRDIVSKMLIELVDSKDDLGEKMSALAIVRDFLTVAPITDALVDEHNERVAALSELCLKLASDMKTENMYLEYVAPEEKVVNVSFATFYALLADFDAAKDIEGRRTAVKALYNLVKVAVFDVENAEYAAIKAAYNEKCAALTAELLAIEDVSALASVKAFLEEAPYTAAAVRAYNAKVDELVADESEATALKVSAPLIKIDELLDAVIAADTPAARAARYLEFNAYLVSVNTYAIDDDHAVVFAKRDEVYATVVEELFASVASSVGVTAKYETLKSVRDYLASVENTEATIAQYNAIADDMVTVCNAAAAELATDFKAIVSLPDALSILLEGARNAEGIEAKMEAFAELYSVYSTASADENDPAYLAFVEEYEQFCISFATELIATVDAATTPADKIEAIKSVNQYLRQNLFSSDVIEKYNAKLVELQGLDYGVYAERVSTETSEGTYTPAETLVTDFAEFEALAAALNTALAGTVPEGAEEGTAPVVDMNAAVAAYTALYNYLSSNVIDMLADGYNEKVVTVYTEARNAMAEAIRAYIKKAVDDPETTDVDENVVAYNFVHSYLAADGMSVKFVTVYNDLREGNSNVDKLATDFKAFKTALTAFENHFFTNATIDRSKLSEADAARYDELLLAVDDDIRISLSASVLTFKVADYSSSASNAVLAKKSEMDRVALTLIKYPNAAPQILKAQISTCQRELNTIMEAQKAIAEEFTNLEEYGWKHTIRDFATGSNPYTFQNSSKTKETSYVDLPNEANGNRYLALNYNSQGGPYIEFRLTETEKLDVTSKGAVVEFDYMATPGAVTSFGCTEDGLDPSGNKTGVRNSHEFFTIKKGSLYVGSSNVAPDTFNFGQWTHVILVVHPYDLVVTKTYDVYVNYVHVGTFTATSSNGDPIRFTRLRIKNSVTYQQVCFDNVQCYNGTGYRNYNKFENMTDVEQFKFFVDYMVNEKYSSVNRAYAYNQAYNLLESVKNNPAVATYIQTLINTDYDSTILVAAKKERMATLIEISAPLYQTVTANNYGSIQMDVDKVDGFIAENATYFDQTAPEFIAIRNRLSKVKSEITRVSALKDLVEALTKFERATSVASMSRHFEAVSKAYELCAFKEGTNYADAMTDPLVKSFLATVPVVDPDFGLAEYCGEYAPAKIAAQQKIENSIRIMKCIGIIEAMEGYEATESFWNANYDYIEHYMYIIRVIVQTDNYDHTYGEIEAAMEKFNEIENYFYVIVKNRNKALIEEYLAKYITASSYIEKRGICAYVDNYIVDNDINVNDEEFAVLVRQLEAYKLELNQYESEYAAILEANTIAFLGIVDKMGAYVTYAELKPLYSEAIEKYYYNMNVDAEETKTALAEFAKHEQFIEAAEENASNLIAAAKKLKSARDQKQLFKALVECSAYVENAETDIEGVSAALATYEAKLAEYNAVIDPLNQQISETNSVVCASRGTNIASTVLAIIKAIFSK